MTLPIPESGGWTFQSPEVAAGFDAHVREQLPWYDLATGIVAHVGRHYVPPGGVVIDVGASTGNVGRALAPTLESRKAHLFAFDNAPDMLERYSGPGSPIVSDAREIDFAGYAPDLIVCFLVLMFLPLAERRALIETMAGSLRPGGALLVFDKMQPLGGHKGLVLGRLTLAAKYEAGAKPDEIIRKELSLAGVQRPMRDDELPADAALIFKFGEFAGWLIER